MNELDRNEVLRIANECNKYTHLHNQMYEVFVKKMKELQEIERQVKNYEALQNEAFEKFNKLF